MHVWLCQKYLPTNPRLKTKWNNKRRHKLNRFRRYKEEFYKVKKKKKIVRTHIRKKICIFKNYPIPFPQSKFQLALMRKTNRCIPIHFLSFRNNKILLGSRKKKKVTCEGEKKKKWEWDLISCIELWRLEDGRIMSLN